VGGSGFLKAEDQGAQVRCLQPLRHAATQDAALVDWIGDATLTSNDQHDAGAVRLRLAQKTMEREMRFALPHSMQVDYAVHLRLAALQALPQATLERRKGPLRPRLRRAYRFRSVCCWWNPHRQARRHFSIPLTRSARLDGARCLLP
jgi:hypothetical protein